MPSHGILGPLSLSPRWIYGRQPLAPSLLRPYPSSFGFEQSDDRIRALKLRSFALSPFESLGFLSLPRPVIPASGLRLLEPYALPKQVEVAREPGGDESLIP